MVYNSVKKVELKPYSELVSSPFLVIWEWVLVSCWKVKKKKKQNRFTVQNLSILNEIDSVMTNSRLSKKTKLDVKNIVEINIVSRGEGLGRRKLETYLEESQAF